ncbi:hypothetical protein AGABI1DRAFT_95620 [Agaricus bisporus var. burnettii JB137-S8]|uniref:C2H2-type domain-containing protein n=1 Tax=Agaricus bisporus var. burnettii (strain JB137-S8 / ATCC MYA-4627 / FGSC 10392) TaxID=597362 RepID=K5WUM2_AGABU|nr:uncharacterized protein AGABI1DRAFT_95620 [Agaricus bisporus var. burnettii JB137-S8]EKM74463.1 hypothetical protein AGABI1DRAFT_95620 [Agaricus bisporus var. burnettii JB137-S8]
MIPTGLTPFIQAATKKVQTGVIWRVPERHTIPWKTTVRRRVINHFSAGLTECRKKKLKENLAKRSLCVVCSEPLGDNASTAHKACTDSMVSVLLDGGKRKVTIKRDETTWKFSCPQCSMSFYSTTSIKRHTKSHATFVPPAASPTSITLPPPTNIDSTTLLSPALRSTPQPTLVTRLPSTTRPPPPDTLQTPLLSRYGLIVNKTFKILICLGCRSVVDPGQVRRHFLTHHKNHPAPPNLQSELEEDACASYPHLTPSPPHPTEPVAPIYGLEDPVPGYRLCNSCKHCFASKKTFDKHPCGSQDSTWTLTAAQRFVNNTSSPWFAVQTPIANFNGECDRWAVYQSQQKSTLDTPHHSYSDDFRTLHQFLRKERWLERIENQRHEDLIHIVTYSTLDTAYGGLHRHIQQFLTSTQKDLDEMYIRRAIGTRPVEEQEKSRVRSHRDVNKPALENYSRIIAGLIILIHRVILNVDITYSFSIPADITDACQGFVEAVSSTHADEERDDEPMDGDVIEESSESSEDDDEGHIPPPPLSPLQYHPRSTSLIQEKLTTLLYLLYTQLPTNELRGQFFTPIYHFLVLSSLRKNGEWAAANSITHTIAALLFTGRLVFAWKTIEDAQEKNIDFSQGEKGVHDTKTHKIPAKNGFVHGGLYVSPTKHTGRREQNCSRRVTLSEVSIST